VEPVGGGEKERGSSGTPIKDLLEGKEVWNRELGTIFSTVD